MASLYHMDKCPVCKGKGYIATGQFVHGEAMGRMEVRPICDECRGSGRAMVPLSDLDAFFKIIGPKTVFRMNQEDDMHGIENVPNATQVVVVRETRGVTDSGSRQEGNWYFDKDNNFVGVGHYE